MMNTLDEKPDFPESYIPNTIGYMQGLLNTLCLFANPDGFRHFCVIDYLELPIEDKNKVVQERVDGIASKLKPCHDYVPGILEEELNSYYDRANIQNSKLQEDTWKYIIWWIAECLDNISDKDFVSSCTVEKSVIKNKENDGIVYCLTVELKYFVIIKIHNIRIPPEELDE